MGMIPTGYQARADGRESWFMFYLVKGRPHFVKNIYIFVKESLHAILNIFHMVDKQSLLQSPHVSELMVLALGAFKVNHSEFDV